MNRKIVSVLAVLVLILSLLAGCGASEPVTASSLLKDSQKYAEEAASMKTHMVMDMAMSGESLQTLGGSVEMSLDMDMDTVKEPMASHMTGKIKAMGIDMDYEAYSVLEGDQMCIYSKVFGNWTVQKTTVDKEALENMKNGGTAELFSKEEKFTLQEKTEDVDGTESYIITGTIEGEDIKELMGVFSGAFPSMGMDMNNADYNGVSVDVKYAVAKEDKKPVYVDMTFKGMENMMGEAAEGVTIDKCTLHMDYLEFNTVDSIEVPQEAIDNATEADSSLTQ